MEHQWSNVSAVQSKNSQKNCIFDFGDPNPTPMKQYW